ncbi:hypothetical protein FXO37_31402 [Capsicum annuum]|nr:hypothetical protein FXO37_31402 [Capsicum annuum]
MLFQNAGTMIKLFKVKEKQREQAENENGKPPVKKQSAGELRLHKELVFIGGAQKRCVPMSDIGCCPHSYGSIPSRRYNRNLTADKFQDRITAKVLAPIKEEKVRYRL